jgi:anti-anti-sigma factor
MTASTGPFTDPVCVVYVDGPLRAPLDEELLERVRAALKGGWKTLVLDLGRVSTIDAAGVGELVSLYNATVAEGGTLQIVHAKPEVRDLLGRVGLFDLLSAHVRNAA